MAQFHDINLARLEQAHAALQAFRQQVQQKLFEWQFAQAGQVVMQAMRPSEVADLMQDLLTDEALRSVQSHFNSVFAELDIEMRALDAPTRRYLDRDQLDGMEQLRMPTVDLPRSRHGLLETPALDCQWPALCAVAGRRGRVVDDRPRHASHPPALHRQLPLTPHLPPD